MTSCPVNAHLIPGNDRENLIFANIRELVPCEFKVLANIEDSYFINRILAHEFENGNKK